MPEKSSVSQTGASPNIQSEEIKMNVMTAAVQMFIIFLLIIVGFTCYKTHLITKENNACLSRLVANVFNPAIIFSSVLENASSGTNDSVPVLFLTAGGIFLFLIITGKILSHFSKNSLEQKHLTELMYIFANVGFIGIPIVKALLGSDKLIYVAIFILEYNILIYTYGTFLLQHKENNNKNTNKKRAVFQLSALKPLLNMGTLACTATLIVFLTGISLPAPLSDSLKYLANATTPLSLMVIGVSLGAQESLLALFTNAKRYLFCLWKLVLIPLLGTFLLKRLPVSEALQQTYMIMMAMPVGNLVLMLVKENGMDDTECACTITLSTLLSVITIPVMVFFYPYL